MFPAIPAKVNVFSTTSHGNELKALEMSMLRRCFLEYIFLAS
jgi:hypothetical protein